MLKNAHIIRQLNEDQKIRLLTNVHTAEDPALTAVGVPRMRWRAAEEGTGSYPAPPALARAWDESLMGEVAESLYRERLAEGTELILTPSPKPRLTPRSPGLSEDPLLSGMLAGAFVRAADRVGVPCAPEGYGFTKAERRALGEEISPVSARDLLDHPFSFVQGCMGVVAEGPSVSPMGLGSVLCRRTDGEDTVSALLAGQICMEGSEEAVKRAMHRYRRIRADILQGKATTAELDAAVACGEALSEETLDEALDRLLDFAAACETRSREAVVGIQTAAELFRRAALSSIVLLENPRRGKKDPPLLPLRSPTRIAVIGEIALRDPLALDGLTAVLTEAGHAVVGTALGYRSAEERNDELTEEALALAAMADTVLLFVGTAPSTCPDNRPPVLSPAEKALCHRLSRLDKPVAVILSSTDGVDLSFMTRAATPFGAVLLADVTCQNGLWAVAEVLTGKHNPNGRLTVTLCAHDAPADSCHTHRPAGPFVGYRYYDTVGCGYRYPFGHGLSYTTFRYSALTEDGFGSVSLCVKNTGSAAGVETVQVYLGMRDSAVLRPRKVLVGFTRVALAPGEKKTVTLPVGSFFGEDEPILLEKGTYTLYVGASVEDIRLTLTRKGGSVPFSPDGRDPAVYLPTVSNIQSQRYEMEAEYPPMKPSLRNLIFGIAALCLAASIKVYDIVTASDSLFLSIVAGLLALGATVFFGMEFMEHRKQSAELDAKREAETAALFGDAASIPVPSAAELFEDRLYVPAETEASEETEESAYDSFADVDPTLTFSEAAAELARLAKESGLSISEDTVRETLAAMASSRLLLVRGMDEEGFAAWISLLGEYFSASATMVRVESGLRSESELLFTDADGVRTPRELMTAMESAGHDRGGMHIAALTDVDPVTLPNYFTPFVRYAHSPRGGCTVTAEGPNGEGIWRIPENLWFILRMRDGCALTDVPAYVAEVAAEVRGSVETGTHAPTERSPFRRFSYGQMLYLCDRLRSDFAVEEDTWRRIDRLEEYAARHTDFAIGNKLWLGLEIHMAVLMSLGETEPAARDTALAARILPVLIPALSGKLPKEERGLCDTLDAIFGEGNTTCSCRFVKESGADVI